MRKIFLIKFLAQYKIQDNGEFYYINELIFNNKRTPYSITVCTTCLFICYEFKNKSRELSLCSMKILKTGGTTYQNIKSVLYNSIYNNFLPFYIR